VGSAGVTEATGASSTSAQVEAASTGLGETVGLSTPSTANMLFASAAGLLEAMGVSVPAAQIQRAAAAFSETDGRALRTATLPAIADGNVDGAALVATTPTLAAHRESAMP